MAEREIIFVDANTIWHRRLAEAFGRIRPTIAFEPSAGLLPGLVGTDVRAGQTTFMSVKLVRGWASKTAFYGQRQLAARIVRAAHDLGVSPVVVLTSPKYRLLARLLSPRFPLVYYCADDYREYEGWGGLRIAEAESEIVRSVQLSVFVSNALRQRAVKEYAVPEDRTFTSPNATEPLPSPRPMPRGSTQSPGCRPRDSGTVADCGPCRRILAHPERLDLRQPEDPCHGSSATCRHAPICVGTGCRPHPVHEKGTEPLLLANATLRPPGVQDSDICNRRLRPDQPSQHRRACRRADIRTSRNRQ